ncbi:MAG: prepilin-type N-terminal cleavage/methylation domain-containing protein [Clostridia bacterium]|nr:prepilin-type N-terminal cleavage/methylation domain-containing protein [Clostridia bacterium]
MKKQNGISLIALVITIIVLLILVGITITSLTGENGILSRASEGREKSKRADLIERVRVEALEEQVENKNMNVSNTKLQEILEKYFTNATTADLTKMDTLLTAKSEYGGFEDITLGELLTGKVEEKTSLKVGNTDLSTVENLSTLYGQTTNYKSISHPNIDWQLFYDDDDNYYVIASDYVPNVELPCNGNTVNGVTYGTTDLVKSTSTTNQHATYCARFCSNSSYNNGVLTTGTIYNNGSSSTAITNNSLSSTYLQWASKNSSSTNYNICAVAYMMDTNKWQSFADGVSEAKAMGGPTIEMLSLSWNAVSEHTTKMTSYTTLTNANSNTKGYIVNSPEKDANFFGTSTNMWLLNDDTKAWGYWLIAPGSSYAYYVRFMFYDGRISNNAVYNGDYGFRPLVAIPK